MSHTVKPPATQTERSERSKPTWADRKTILIVNQDANFGLQIAKSLCPDGHEVLGPVSSLDGAYTLIVNEKPTIAVLDATMPSTETSRLSDMLIMLDVPHLVADRENDRLTRVQRIDGDIVEKNMALSRSLVEEISDAIWDIHSRSLIFDLLDGPNLDIAV